MSLAAETWVSAACGGLQSRGAEADAHARPPPTSLRWRHLPLSPLASLLADTIAFSLAFLGYEARTGLNPTANVADIVKIW